MSHSEPCIHTFLLSLLCSQEESGSFQFHFKITTVLCCASTQGTVACSNQSGVVWQPQVDQEEEEEEEGADGGLKGWKLRLEVRGSPFQTSDVREGEADLLAPSPAPTSQKEVTELEAEGENIVLAPKTRHSCHRWNQEHVKQIYGTSPMSELALPHL